MLTPSQGIYKWHPPSGHFSKSAGGTQSHLSRISDGILMENPKRKPRKRSSGSELGKNSPLREHTELCPLRKVIAFLTHARFRMGRNASTTSRRVPADPVRNFCHLRPRC
ncbi:hypothetical protein AVEN_82560-1 [Araneus ventricosus]|uniref:Uncharacterized protein n=1 Tax=Araneus ventricosus TaxID=182803 RepID=A0A4Y2W218_ARAVE|nr:hypothetical protein AVEN_82560-1 [Araneus ventricosus]